MSEIKDYLKKYSQLPGVRAIGVGGSRSANSFDSTSDYDIYVFTDRVPEREERERIVLPISSKYEICGDYFGPGDEYLVDSLGVEFDVMFFDCAWFEGIVRSTWIEGNASNGYTTCFLYTLNNLTIEFEKDGWLSALKKTISTPYPEKLRENIIHRNMMLMKDKPFSSYLEQVEKAVNRGDLNSISHRRAAFMESYFDALFAASRLLHPGEKRLISFSLSNCPLLPEDFETDMKKALNQNGPELVNILSCMVEKLRKVVSRMQ